MKDYYIGLDIGTNSVGWAATDTDYNLLKFKGNAEWGIRLLEESNPADERRGFRNALRRIERKKYRIQCLEMLFDKEIAKTDIAFYQRLRESNLLTEDKTLGGKFSLFNDKDYTDIDYHRDFPTIYHLRRRLLTSTEPMDVRLVFLAVRHIVKNRGHFLFDSELQGDSKTPQFTDVWNELTVYLNDEYEIALDCQSIDEVKDILKDKSLSITAKKTALAEKFSVTKKDVREFAVLSLLAGATVKTDGLFEDDTLNDTPAAKITFASNFDDKAPEYESALGERYHLIERLKAVYDWAILAEILNNHEYLSFAKCEIYDKHKQDLATLKAFVKEYIPEKFDRIFNENKSGTNNYCAYSGHCKKSAIEKKCEQQDFMDFLKKELPKENPSQEYEKMYSEIALGTFMPKIVSKDNSVIPMQVNKAELKVILQNASAYLPFLTETDESGKTVAEKIMDVFAFRIPYYVGPLNKHSDKSWLERTDEKIYPWNFDKVVDVEKSAENFINNLTSKCTYIPTEDVLAKNSPIYCKFRVLNELNNLKIDQKPISVQLKQDIYRELFLRYTKVTATRLKNYLKSQGFGECEISGIDGTFKNNLKPLIELAEFNLTDEEKEDAVATITIFGDDRKLLKKRLKMKFGEKLSDEEILKLSKLKYSDWGKLSYKFLAEICGTCKETGEVNTIISFMWDTNLNLMQLLSGDYTFLKTLDEINGENRFTTLKQEVEELYVSPKVKRPIYQSMQIVEELVKINGCEPKKIFIEMARGEEENKTRKISRKATLVERYKACKKDNLALYESLLATDENEFRRDALYLYYTQFGKCMYTGKVIPLADIFNRNLYDIDHIFPQSKIKDDSLDNRVLVCKVDNEKKNNVYPISADVRERMKGLWYVLKQKELISEKKYDRLTRSTPLTDEELSAFINRQLVETRQSTKAIAQLLSKRYNSKLVYVKAGLVSEFRHHRYVKCREINDFHHAKDAYLNIVVGNVYYTRFTEQFFFQNLRDGKVSLNAMFDHDTKGAWVADGDNRTIDTVTKTMRKNNIRYTRYAYKQTGGLFDQLLLKKGHGQVPIKKDGPRSDIEKYGGYNKATCTYFALVAYKDKKGNTVKQFVPIDLYKEKDYRQNPKQYIDALLNKDSKFPIDATVLIPCVKYNALVSVDGFRMHISQKVSGGKQIGYKPAMQLVLDVKHEIYVKKISEYLKKCLELREVKPITSHDGITLEGNIALWDAICDKLCNTVLNVKFANTAEVMQNKKDTFCELSLKEQCDVLMQILNIVHSNVLSGDLTLIGEAKSSGIIFTNSKIAPSKTTKSFKLINQSVTGLFEQETELLN